MGTGPRTVSMSVPAARQSHPGVPHRDESGWPTIGLALRQLHKVVKAGGSRKNSKNTPAQMRKLSKAWER